MNTALYEASAVSHGVAVLDQSGRWWCMLGRHGFTRAADGRWWFGSISDGADLEVTAAGTLAELEVWMAGRVWR